MYRNRWLNSSQYVFVFRFTNLSYLILLMNRNDFEIPMLYFAFHAMKMLEVITEWRNLINFPHTTSEDKQISHFSMKWPFPLSLILVALWSLLSSCFPLLRLSTDSTLTGSLIYLPVAVGAQSWSVGLQTQAAITVIDDVAQKAKTSCAFELIGTQIDK